MEKLKREKLPDIAVGERLGCQRQPVFDQRLTINVVDTLEAEGNRQHDHQGDTG